MNTGSKKTTPEICYGLRCCQYPQIRCGECPYQGKILCQDKLRADALGAIRLLEAEKDRRDRVLGAMGVKVREEET